jgi:hypothetical protein
MQDSSQILMELLMVEDGPVSTLKNLDPALFEMRKLK